MIPSFDVCRWIVNLKLKIDDKIKNLPDELVLPQHLYPKVQVYFALDTICSQNLIQQQTKEHGCVVSLVFNRSEIAGDIIQYVID